MALPPRRFVTVREATAAQWDPDAVLADGEVGVVRPEGLWKVGDGETLWSELGYLGSAAPASGSGDRTVEATGDDIAAISDVASHDDGVNAGATYSASTDGSMAIVAANAVSGTAVGGVQVSGEGGTASLGVSSDADGTHMSLIADEFGVYGQTPTPQPGPIADALGGGDAGSKLNVLLAALRDIGIIAT